MALALGAHGAQGSIAGNSSAVTLSTTAGSILIAMVVSGATGATIADTLLNGWTSMVANQAVTGGSFAQVYSVWKNEGGSRGVAQVFTGTNVGQFPSTFIIEITGTSVIVDATGTANNSATPYVSSALSNVATNAFYIMCSAFDKSDAGGSLSFGGTTVFTLGDNVLDGTAFYPGATAYFSASSVASRSSSFTAAGGATITRANTFVLTVKESGGGGTDNRIRFPSQQSATGVGGMLGGNRLNQWVFQG